MDTNKTTFDLAWYEWNGVQIMMVYLQNEHIILSCNPSECTTVANADSISAQSWI